MAAEGLEDHSRLHTCPLHIDYYQSTSKTSRQLTMYTHRHQHFAPRRVQQPYQAYSPFYADSSYIDPRSQYAYDTDYYYREPEAYDELAYEEERLRQAERQIAAQRQRIAEERRRVAREAELRRIHELRVQQEASRRAQIAYQQRLAQQQAYQQQARQRQLSALKEAQLEAALQDLDFQDSYNRPRQVTAPEPSTEERTDFNPLELLFGLFAPSSYNVKQSKSASSQPKAQCQQFDTMCGGRGRQGCSKRQQQRARAEIASSSATHAPVAKPSSPTTSKPAAPISSILSGLRSRIDNASKNVSSLLNAAFENLSLRQFGVVDHELMNILLSLDGVDAKSEEARELRKALVKETVGLLEKVDQHKDAYSSASSDASSSSETSSTDAEEQNLSDASAESDEEEPEKVLVDVPVVDGESPAPRAQKEEPVEEIDADSEGSVVEDQVDQHMDIERSESEPTAEVEAESSTPAAPILPFALKKTESPAVTTNEANSEHSSAPTDSKPSEENRGTEVESVASTPINEAPSDSNPSGPSNNQEGEPEPDYNVVLPIKIGAGKKSSVTIEKAS